MWISGFKGFEAALTPLKAGVIWNSGFGTSQKSTAELDPEPLKPRRGKPRTVHPDPVHPNLTFCRGVPVKSRNLNNFNSPKTPTPPKNPKPFEAAGPVAIWSPSPHGNFSSPHSRVRVSGSCSTPSLPPTPGPSSPSIRLPYLGDLGLGFRSTWRFMVLINQSELYL